MSEATDNATTLQARWSELVTQIGLTTDPAEQARLAAELAALEAEAAQLVEQAA